MSKQATCGSCGARSSSDADRREVVRLVQRRERHELLERRQHRRVDAHRLRVLEPAVHDAVADADQAVLGELLAQERDQVIERAVVAELDALAPRLLAEQLAPAASLATKRGAV